MNLLTKNTVEALLSKMIGTSNNSSVNQKSMLKWGSQNIKIFIDKS